MKTLFYALAIIILIAIAYGAYKLERWVNWKFGYESSVERIIEERVRPECLK